MPTSSQTEEFRAAFQRILVTSSGEATDRSRQEAWRHGHRDAVLIMMAYRHAKEM